MTPTHILQQEERERREALGLPPLEVYGFIEGKSLSADVTTYDLKQKHTKNRWRDIKKGKQC